jgi:choline dehydrogenase-like flavoprotein
MYFPADELTDDLLLRKRHNLSLHLWKEARGIRWYGDDLVEVFVRDSRTGEESSLRGRCMIIAAGSFGTPDLLLRSRLRNVSSALGQGITDHSLYFTRFAIPPGSRFYRASSTSKTISYRHGTTPDNDAFIVSLELGVGFHQSRWGHVNVLPTALYMRQNSFVSEIVFLRHEQLNERNRLYLDSETDSMHLDMVPTAVPQSDIAAMNAIKDRVIEALGGEPLEGSTLELSRAGMGLVAHEVGSARIGRDGVVDENLRLHGYSNIYVCDNSVAPVAFSANPTLSIACLAMRLADHISTSLIDPARPTMISVPAAFAA